MTFDFQRPIDTNLSNLSDDEFVEAWTQIIGEVPAAIVDRGTMVRLLLEATDLSNESATASRSH